MSRSLIGLTPDNKHIFTLDGTVHFENLISAHGREGGKGVKFPGWPSLPNGSVSLAYKETAWKENGFKFNSFLCKFKFHSFLMNDQNYKLSLMV